MRSRLEKFIDENRREFDSEDPSPLVWNNIQHKLEPKASAKTFNMNASRWAAAAAILVVILGAAYFLIPPDKGNTDLAGTTEPPVNTQEIIEEINPAYAKEVYHFTQLIELKQGELEQIKKAQPELYNTFLADITKLDSLYKGLQKQLPQNPNREQLLEAMIQNLRLQTELLNQQLLIIQKIKKSKSNSNENSKNI